MEEHNLPPPKIKPAPAARDKRPPKKITATYLHNAGLAYLERFPAATGQFRQVMMRKIKRSCRFHKDQDETACADLLADLIRKFTDMGLLNDAGYMRGMVHSLRRRGLSAAGITAKLTAKGLSAAAIRAELSHQSEAEGEHGDIVAALRLCARKRLGPFRQAPARKTPEQELAALARYGYGYDTARQALDMTPEEAAEIIRNL